MEIQLLGISCTAEREARQRRWTLDVRQQIEPHREVAAGRLRDLERSQQPARGMLEQLPRQVVVDAHGRVGRVDEPTLPVQRQPGRRERPEKRFCALAHHALDIARPRRILFGTQRECDQGTPRMTALLEKIGVHRPGREIVRIVSQDVLERGRGRLDGHVLALRIDDATPATGEQRALVPAIRRASGLLVLDHAVNRLRVADARLDRHAHPLGGWRNRVGRLPPPRGERDLVLRVLEPELADFVTEHVARHRIESGRPRSRAADRLEALSNRRLNPLVHRGQHAMGVTRRIDGASDPAARAACVVDPSLHCAATQDGFPSYAH